VQPPTPAKRFLAGSLPAASPSPPATDRLALAVTREIVVVDLIGG
jgi:hypothetical protein